GPPQALQVPTTQRVPLAVQNVGAAPPPASPPPQQAWASAPQGVPAEVLHDPFEHVPTTPAAAQDCPVPTHCWAVCPPVVTERQQPPLLQELAPQHGCPGAPQAAA